MYWPNEGYYRVDTFEKQKSRALDAINDLTSQVEKDYLTALYDILKEKKYATVINNKNCKMDVEAFAWTSTYASFFDIYHCMIYKHLNLDIMPIETTELYNKFSV